MTLDAPGRAPETALVVVVPEAAAVEPWRARFDPVAAFGVPAHVTLLYPFVPAGELDQALLADLHELFAGASPFDVCLARVERWPQEIVYLAPEPARPFAELTEELTLRYPDYPPYRGIHDEVVPHLTVGRFDGDPGAAEIAVAELTAVLPIRARVSEARLLAQGADGRWRLHTAFPFGAG
ncbi:MAG: 2'-5' RNA ligase family protein [Gaiellaceae bacterium]